jgi:NADH-quinone oxidoreductase subunit J
MTPVATTFFFYFLAILAVASALATVVQKNPVHSALALIVTLLAIAGLYLMLYAPFIAGVQIVLYAGGIMVLFLFVIMLVNIEQATHEERFNKQWPVALIAAISLGVLLLCAYLRKSEIFPSAGRAFPENTNTQDIALMLYRNYMMPFEIASVVLLVAIVGAVVMAKRRV